MVITGGYNVYPRDVEDALLSHPSAAEAAIVGAPDPKRVEAIVAFVVLRIAPAYSEANLIAHVASWIASYKKPHCIVLSDALPSAQLRAPADK
ncbi:MAG: hypothetical protein LAT81_06870 [Oceanicaulis sp.]|nr:hypothetical protein [Oceanicaulis sp.]